MITENTLRVKIEATGDGELKATLNSAAQSVAALDTAQQGATATTTAATTAQAENAAALAAVGLAATDAAAQVAAGSVVAGESAAQQTARIKAMVAASLEQQAANSGIALSERALAEAAGQRVELSAAEWAAIQANAEATRAQVAAETEAIVAADADTVALKENTAAHVENAAAKGLNSRVTYSLSALLDDAASGQLGRSKRELGALASETGLTASLFTPMGLAIAGVTASLGLFVAAMYKGEEQETALNRAIESTGNYAGVTASQLDAMAESMAGGTVTIGRAREAVAALTDTGRFTGEQIGKLAQATLDAGDLMGQSVKQVVGEFVHLQESPVAASEALNQSMHYLTTSILQQIEALQKQGDVIGAADLAMNTYADSLRSRTEQANAQLGTLQSAWNSVKSSASFAWDAMLGIGRPNTDLSRANDQYDALLKQRTAVADVAAGNKPGYYEQLSLPSSLAKGAEGNFGWFSDAPTEQAQTAAKAMLGGLDTQLAAMRSAMQPLEAAASGAASAQQAAQDVQAAGTQGVETLARLGISLDGLKNKQDKVNAAAAAFYAIHLAGGKLPDGVDFNGPAADTPEGPGWEKIKAGLLAAKRPKKDPEVSAFSTFQSQVDALDTNHAAETQAEKQYADAIDKKNAALQQSIDNQVASVGMGAKEYQRSQQITQQYTDEANALSQLALKRQMGVAGQSGGISQSQYEVDVAKVKEGTDQAVQILTDGYARVDAAQADWHNGAKAALKDYADAAMNVAAQVNQGFSTLSTDMEGSLADWVKGGKLSFKTFEADFENMLAHMVTKALLAQAETALLSMFSPSAGAFTGLGGSAADYSAIGSGGGMPSNYSLATAGHADGGKIKGAGTGTSDSILARLSNGEYVQTADAVDYYGEQFMDDVRAKRLPRYAEGGMVGSGGGGGGGGQLAPQIIVQNNGNNQVSASSQQQPDGRWITTMVIDAVAADIAGGGKSAKAMQQRFGLQRRGVPVGG